MVEFKLFGIPVRVEPSIWLILGIFGFLNFGIESTQGIISIGLLIIAGFTSILVHELGHALMIKKYKLPTQIVLAGFGGFATHPAGILTRKQSFIVTLAGPLLQIILGLTIYFIAPTLNIPPNSLINIFIEIIILVSIAWALLNCLPILPLDGGRMLDSALGPKKLKTTLLIGLITAVIVGILAYAYGFFFGAMFMGFFFYQNFQAYKQTP